MIVCHACGHELPGSSRFCGHCGAKLGALPEKTQAQTHDTIFGLTALSPGCPPPASDAHAADAQSEIADTAGIADEPLQSTITTEPILEVVGSPASPTRTTTADAQDDAQTSVEMCVEATDISDTEDSPDKSDADSDDTRDDEKPTFAHLEAVSKCEVMSGHERSAHAQEALHVSDDDTPLAQAAHTSEISAGNETKPQAASQNDNMLLELERQIEEGKKAAERLEALRQQQLAELEALRQQQLAELEAAKAAAEAETARAAAEAETARAAAEAEAARVVQHEVPNTASSQANDNSGKGKRKGNKGRVRVRATSGTLETRQTKPQAPDTESDEPQSAAAIPEAVTPETAAPEVNEPTPKATTPILATVSKASPKQDSVTQPSVKPKAVVEMGGEDEDEDDEAFDDVFDEDDEESFFGKRMSQQFSVVNLAAVGRIKAKKSGKRRTIVLVIAFAVVLIALAYVAFFL